MSWQHHQAPKSFCLVNILKIFSVTVYAFPLFNSATTPQDIQIFEMQYLLTIIPSVALNSLSKTNHTVIKMGYVYLHDKKSVKSLQK